MRVAVADTGPLNYLILIGCIEIVPSLFGAVLIPDAVLEELRRPAAPDAVRAWASALPYWVEIGSIKTSHGGPSYLDRGESDVLRLAGERGATLILMDDRRGRVAAEAGGLTVIGTLGILAQAARRGTVDLPAAVSRLRDTNFRASESVSGSLDRRLGRSPAVVDSPMPVAR